MPTDPALADRDAWLRERGAVLFHAFTWAHLSPYMREKALRVLLEEAHALYLATEGRAYDGITHGDAEPPPHPEEEG